MFCIIVETKDKIMRTYWAVFIDEYEKEIIFVSMALILEAFWHHSQGSFNISDGLMGRNQPTKK